MTAYYNEIDPFAAAWLRELIKAGHIAQGEVDERDIQDVVPSDLRDFTQCHFFAGIGVWSYALRQAGWPDDRLVWTGSCPCQPFSAAGKRGGVTDERHLWPAFFHLIQQSLPPTIFAEQVASKDGLTWLDTVSTDLENAGYAVGAEDLCAAGFGAPHIRQRLYFVADSQHSERRSERQEDGDAHRRNGLGRSGNLGDGEDKCGNSFARSESINGTGSSQTHTHIHTAKTTGTNAGDAERLGYSSRRNTEVCGCGRSGMADSNGRNPGAEGLQRSGQHGQFEEDSGSVPVVGNSDDTRSQGRLLGRLGTDQLPSGAPGLVNGVWREADWIYCRDEKYRPVEAGTFPLAHGIANRVGKLRGYGNAIVAPVAQAFIESFLEVESGV